MTPSNETLSMAVSDEPIQGRHIIRWIEQMPWGPNTLLITTCTPDELPRERESFALFCKVPLERRTDAAAAVRRSPLPVRDVLQQFMPAVPQGQPSLF